MTEEINGQYVLKHPTTIVWPKLITAEGFEKKPPLYYSIEWLLEPDGEDIVALKKLFAAVARAESQEPFGTMNNPFRDGDREADKQQAKPKSKGRDVAAYYRGKVILKSGTGTDYPPALGVFKNNDPKQGVIDLGNNPALRTQYTGDKNGGGWFYSGAIAGGVVRLKFYKKKNDTQRDGVKAYLSGVVSTGKGERLAGGINLTSVYGSVTHENPTEGNADDIPF